MSFARARAEDRMHVLLMSTWPAQCTLVCPDMPTLLCKHIDADMATLEAAFRRVTANSNRCPYQELCIKVCLQNLT